MSEKPLVSTIIIFLNAERFLEEAVRSVLDQTYKHFELILVDDGSSDGSAEIARQFVNLHPDQVRYFDHPGHLNLGKGASRNLGIKHSRGDFIAFLDADDIWMPDKLRQQTKILEDNPRAGMLYGDTLYWFSWTRQTEDAKKDFIPTLGIAPNKLVEAPNLLPLYLRGKAAVPCTCSIILRRELVNQVRGFEEEFRGISNIYEDQAFYAKVCLKAPVLAMDICWDKYRQHPDASVSVADELDQETEARRLFLVWLRKHLREVGESDQRTWQAVRQELWRLHYPEWLFPSDRLRPLIRWIKKWILTIEELISPASFQAWVWNERHDPAGSDQ